MPRYAPSIIEPKWQKYWEENRTFATPRLPEGKKLYVLDMFPYPSGEGLHVGHPEGYTATDIVCRYQRMRGVSVLHPMGFDAFGLPAEEHAIKTNAPPRESTERNIATFRRQLKMLGFSYDWDREIATTDIDYFCWTQWIFLQIYDTWFDHEQKKGRPISELPISDDIAANGDAAIQKYRDAHRLAYQVEAPVNWCPALGTVLANEEVIGGVSERGGHPISRIPLRQWMLRITAFADRLLSDLDSLSWPDSIKTQQRNWIGRSEGAEVDFFIGDSECADLSSEFQLFRKRRAEVGFAKQSGDNVLRVYTTRPDTLFGATYMVIAPEHPYVERLTTSTQKTAVRSYCEKAAAKSDLDRTDLAKEKTGVFTGSYAINPVDGSQLPIWIADYVLITYGTGAIMAVPAHDVRDFEFAEAYKLPVIPVVDPGGGDEESSRHNILAGEAVYVEDGTAMNSGEYNGLSTAQFKEAIISDLAKNGMGSRAVNYKLRDWLFSRQRFWGEPFPILHELDERRNATGVVVALSENDLPIDLPKLGDYTPHGRPEPLLEKAPESWLYPRIDGKLYKRETNTMPQWAGSCWYYLRFIDPKNDKTLCAPELERAWMPVDMYVGGAEHAVLHLLYARFWHKVLYDRGIVSTSEPFQRLINQGMILGEVEFTAFKDKNGSWITAPNLKVKVDDEDATTGEELVRVRVSPNDVEKIGEVFVLKTNPSVRVVARAYKMSKSRGNVVNPDRVVADYGADSLRLYEMFMGPLEATKPWSMAGVNGVRGFLDRVWRLITNDRSESAELNVAVQNVQPPEEHTRVLHKTVKAVTEDIDNLAFNTAISRMMEFTNYFTKCEVRPKSIMERFVLLLSPFAPHICEELWNILGHETTLAYERWPEFNESYIVEERIDVPVQVAGKVRGTISVPVDASSEELESAARADARIASFLAGKKIINVVVVPGRIVSFVMG